MKSKARVIMGVIVLAVFGTMAFLNFSKSVAPYVGFAEARAAAGGSVQVAGYPEHQRASFDMEAGTFLFTIKDEDGDSMPVVFKGVKPGNFDQAEKVVVIGRYNEGTLEANKILVKCPSKYDDEASKEYSTGA